MDAAPAGADTALYQPSAATSRPDPTFCQPAGTVAAGSAPGACRCSWLQTRYLTQRGQLQPSVGRVAAAHAGRTRVLGPGCGGRHVRGPLYRPRPAQPG